jgi:ABC-type Mn2+/Zn2+ transport system ATPase subunit
MYAVTQINLINLDVFLQCLVAFVSIDIFVINKNKSETNESYSEYWTELNHYLSKYKLNICFIGFVILCSTIVSSITQFQQIHFVSNLYLGKVSYYDLTVLTGLFVLQIVMSKFSIFMDKYLINPIKKDTRIHFMNELTKGKIENLENYSEHELKTIMDKKKDAVIAGPKGLQRISMQLINIVVNTISISTISIKLAFHVMIFTYFYFRLVCWKKLKENEKLEKERSTKFDDFSKKTNYIIQDSLTFYQFQNIKAKTNHLEKIEDIIDQRNKFVNKSRYGWETYYQLIELLAKINWLIVTIQLCLDINDIPKEKISIVLSACTHLCWNFNWISNSMSNIITEIASYESFVKLKNKLNQEVSSRNISLKFGKDGININGNEFQNGFNQLTGKSGSGKTTFLKRLFYQSREFWNKIAILYQSSRQEFNHKKPFEVIVGFLEYDEKYLNKAYQCIELEKKGDLELPKPSGGEVQKLRIGQALYQALLIDAKLIILDEPDNNIDLPTFNKIMMNIIKLLPDSVILYTTHKGEVVNFEFNKIDIILFKK